MTDQPNGLLLTLECTLDAPRERIFQMMTEPAELVKWWGPRGFSLPAAELRLAVGGRYRFSMQPPDGDVFHLSGEFVELSAPSRLGYTFRWEEPTPDDHETTVTLTLDPAGENATRLCLKQGPFTTAERLALHRNGWTDAFEKLREAIAAG